MAKKLDLTKSVYELTQEYPELIDIMEKLGFTDITRKPVLHSVGKVMTIPKGAKLKGIPMMKVVTTLMMKGFQLVGQMPDLSKLESDEETSNESDLNGSDEVEEISSENGDTDRTEQIKSYLLRLGNGEELESVQTDFIREFGDVDASEIMQAEQQLIKDGTPIEEVQKLCDVHSALFHGSTREEKIANAERAVNESLKSKVGSSIPAASEIPSGLPQRDYTDKEKKAQDLTGVYGHPLYTFAAENEAFERLLEQYKQLPDDESAVRNYVLKVRDISIHYAKKGDLLYPHLKVKYGVSGPSDVMWTVDDEIRDELGALVKTRRYDDTYRQRLDAVIKRAGEMIFKERNILFPICAANFTEEEWMKIYADSKDYAPCFEVENGVWERAKNYLESAEGGNAVRKSTGLIDGEIVMPGGHMTVEQMTAMLNTMPFEITFVDADNINRFFNEGPKDFKRPGMAIDREVFSCHPPKIEPMVRNIIDSFRDGSLDSVPVWMEKNGKTMLVTYMAVRTSEGKYVGTLELVQNMEFAREHFE